MGTFGERLRREREMRGIGLDEIATATKISTRNLKALEDEKFSQLPGGIFNKGFVRAYAKFLGIDQEQIVAEYEAAAEQTETAREQKLRQDFAKPDIKTRDEEREINLEPKSQWGTIAIIVLLAVLGFSGYSVYQRKKAEKQREAAAQQAAAAAQMQQAKQQAPPVLPPVESQVVTPGDATATNPTGTPADSRSAATTPAGVASTQTPTNPSTAPTVQAAQKNTTQTPASATPSTTTTEKLAETGPSPINLVVKVNQETWMSVKADGKTLVNGTITQGTERSFKAKDKIEVVLGRAKAVDISYNGKPIEGLNSGQDVRKLTFTPSGYE